VGKLRKIMLENDGLDKLRWNLLSSISCINEQNHFLVLMVQLEAVIKSSNVEYSSLASRG
jgi:hypothetical protein